MQSEYKVRLFFSGPFFSLSLSPPSLSKRVHLPLPPHRAETLLPACMQERRSAASNPHHPPLHHSKVAIDTTYLNNFHGLLGHFAKNISGYTVYNGSTESLNAAATYSAGTPGNNAVRARPPAFQRPARGKTPLR